MVGTINGARTDRLVEIRIDVLLCGRISAPILSLVDDRGIRVIPWIAGEGMRVATLHFIFYFRVAQVQLLKD